MQIIGILLIVLFGYLLSVILVENLHLVERIGVSYLLGLGVYTLLMFIYSTLGLRITFQSTLLVLLAGIFILFMITRLLRRNMILDFNNIVKSIFNLPILEKSIVLIILGFIIGSIVVTTYFPVYIWDALALYDFRARIIAEFGYYTQLVNNYVWFGGYPLFTSLSHSLVYVFGGHNPQFLYSLMYMSFIFIFYGSIREIVNRKLSLISTLILTTTPVFFDHSTFAYTNLPYSIFLSMGSIYLFVWFAKNKSIGYLLLAATMTGLSTWTRSTEPFWMINIFILIILSAYRFKIYFIPMIKFSFIVWIIRTPWNFVNKYIIVKNIERDNLIQNSDGNSYIFKILQNLLDFPRIQEVLIYIYKFVIVSWYPLVILFILCLFLNVKYLFNRINSLFLLIIVLYFALLVFGVYLFTFEAISISSIPDSARRMAMFFMPLMIYYIGLTMSQFISNNNG